MVLGPTFLAGVVKGNMHITQLENSSLRLFVVICKGNISADI
jgi:hypothetical protein